MSRKKPTKPKKKKAQKGFIKNALKWLFVLGLWGGIIGVVIMAWYAGALPDITKRATFDHKSSITIKAADGSMLARYGEIRGNSVSIEELPSHLIYAILSIEDRRFYQHFGVDPLGLARALLVNIKAGRTVQGGSTITQQLAKNLFLSHERTLKRKIQEAMLALWLESQLTKDEILSAYLNRVYLGSGAYGVDAASRLYFKKPVGALTIRESALLAGLLKAPSRYSPLRNPKLAEKRTNIVLRAMVDAGFILEAKANELIDITTTAAPASAIVHANSKRYFTDWILEQLDDLVGTPNENIIIETTLNPYIQTAAQQALTETILTYGEERAISQGAVIVMHSSGAVLGIIGGYNYAKSQFNRATQARRQPGSAFKPILYLTALEKGWRSESLILDAPIEKGEYRPKNFNEEYKGEITLQTALTHSSNTAATRLMKETGPKPVIDTARKLGITSKLSRDLSLSLGSSGLSPLELTRAYAVIANGGFKVRTYGITKITNEEGELYYQRSSRKKMPRIIQKKHAKELTSMMQNVINEGTGRNARLPYPASGKTGTSQNSRDAWFVGFSNNIVTGVWLGNDDNSPMDNVTGGSFPAKIWKKTMLASKGRYKAFKSGKSLSSGFKGLISRITSSAPEKPSQEGYNN